MREPLRLILTTAPAELPLSLGEIKAQLRLEDAQTSEDALLLGLIRGATDACETFTGRALITQTWTLFRDAWPGAAYDAPLVEGLHQGIETPGLARALELPKAPLQSIVHVKTFDEADSETLWPASNYITDTAGEPGRLIARSGVSFPTPSRAANGIEIRFTAGYGGNPASVPEPLRQGILQAAAFLYEHRGDTAPQTALHAAGAAAVWQPFRLAGL